MRTIFAIFALVAAAPLGMPVFSWGNTVKNHCGQEDGENYDESAMRELFRIPCVILLKHSEQKRDKHEK